MLRRICLISYSGITDSKKWHVILMYLRDCILDTNIISYWHFQIWNAKTQTRSIYLSGLLHASIVHQHFIDFFFKVIYKICFYTIRRVKHIVFGHTFCGRSELSRKCKSGASVQYHEAKSTSYNISSQSF